MRWRATATSARLNIRLNHMSADFMRARFIPAVRANASLRKLIAAQSQFAMGVEYLEAARQMENIVAAR